MRGCSIFENREISVVPVNDVWRVGRGRPVVSSLTCMLLRSRTAPQCMPDKNGHHTTKDRRAHIQVWQRIPEYGIIDMAIWYYGGPL
jgi:hypothetical protein